MPIGGPGVPHPSMRGEGNHQAFLTWDEVRGIRHTYASTDMGYRRLAAEYGVSRTMIYHIIRGTKWVDPAYVPPAPKPDLR